jgi:hypothetical protein
MPIHMISASIKSSYTVLIVRGTELQPSSGPSLFVLGNRQIDDLRKDRSTTSEKSYRLPIRTLPYPTFQNKIKFLPSPFHPPFHHPRPQKKKIPRQLTSNRMHNLHQCQRLRPPRKLAVRGIHRPRPARHARNHDDAVQDRYPQPRRDGVVHDEVAVLE